jgi:DNA-binding Lrp family transcriptional regulator
MAISKAARSKIFTLVQEIKKLLVHEVASQLQQYYGIRPDGSILMIEQLPATEPEILHTARLLRQRIDYIKSNLTVEKHKDQEAIKQLLNEQAFSILNRFATLRMAEERGIIKETIRKDFNSEGFQIYDSITGQGAVAEQYIRYKWYLHSIFDELAIDLPSVFDRFSPYALIFPSEKAMRSLLTIINNEQVTMHREEGVQPINLWREDETIGWIYQYYNSREEISEMRDASSAPRNSRELAVRNQFFTPRYVVQFLTDNSLGRIWYEMTKGKTELIHTCQYLIRRPKELFLEKGNTRPDNTDEETDYIEHRPLKDPREILMLDPACGSMHFGLYSFDLFEQIYVEAWDHHPELLLDLRNSITRKQYIKQIPEYIIRYNIHGVDIDPRALQIAALSLWLRAQKSFEKLNIEARERPQITKSNLVLAEAMPGNAELLNELVKPLDAPMRKLVTAIWDLMKMAGETGLLLRIEEEIDKKINEILEELSKEAKGVQLKLNVDEAELNAAELAAFYASKQYRDSFLENAATEVFRILKELAETANEGEAYQKLLFADDAARGFAFIELCRKKYDVVLMNPPFGSASMNTEAYLQSNYPSWGKNILTAFFERMLELINNDGLVGAIFDRTVVIKSSYEDFRVNCFCGHITAMADTGWNVLDANVETTTILLRKFSTYKNATFIDLLEIEEKGKILEQDINSISHNTDNPRIYFNDSLLFTKLPNSIIGYYFKDYLINYFSNNRTQDFVNGSRQGHALNSGKHFRLFFEITNHSIYKHLYNGSPYKLFYIPYREITYFTNNGDFIRLDKSLRYSSGEYQLLLGVGWGKRGEMISAHILKPQSIFTVEGIALPGLNILETKIFLSYINSIVAQYVINTFCALHKYSGYVNLLPFPFNINNDYAELTDLISKLLFIKRKWYSLDETCLEFNHLLSVFSRTDSLKKQLELLQVELNADKIKYLNLVQINDNFWLKEAAFPDEANQLLAKYKNKRPVENLLSIDGILDSTIQENPVICYEIISNLVGIAFGRWDIRSIINPELIPEFGDFFDPLPFMPVVSINKIPKDYPIIVSEDGILIEDNSNLKSLEKAITNVIYKIWPDSGTTILNELLEIGNINSLEQFFSNPNGFFDFHYKRYTKSRREAPIYWPISTTAGSYTIWLYYPKLSDQTLVAVINNYLQPKIDEVISQKKPLEINSNLDNKGLKELKELNDFQHELEEMKKELLRITVLPYKPNHDDGVLITAAPLYHLFRHTKWRKSTEECWKALEKGEYDWAHLAYSIWPDRVTQKCRKDLSMAIAHGLEDICEVKPKETKAKAKKAPAETKVNPQLNLEI